MKCENNILLVDKPKHWTSNDVIRKFKAITKIKKVGHSGTLDPLATGLLLLGYNSGTKKLNTIIDYYKVYIATIHFNYETDTYDSEGKIINYKYKNINIDKIKDSLEYFKNSQYFQTPPKFSAIKIQGKKAYELARNNVNFKIVPKLVKLIDYKIISYQFNELIIELKVSKGFYIRSFCHDLGIHLDNYANLAGLIRTQIGDYLLKDAIKLENINENIFK